MNYVFMTDSDSDLPYDLKVKYDIPVVNMPYAINGTEYFDDLGQTINSKDYFDAMRNGAVPITSALNETAYMEIFEPILKEHDLLFVAFSSKMSSTIHAIEATRKELLEKYPERRFELVDTLSISGPMTLLILKAHEMYRNGASIDEVATWLRENYDRANAFFMVDDLKYLKRGGRISPTAAAIGSMLDLKPIITETREGTLTAISKQRGRRKAISYMVEQALANLDDPKESVMIILNADCPQDAENLKKELLNKVPALEIRIDNVGPVIGAHCGPGTLAICFMGKHRPY
jgi:DegV family protein with EDD domain